MPTPSSWATPAGWAVIRRASPTKITGYTAHGLHQVIGRNGGRGVSVKAISDAISNPMKVTHQSNDTWKFVGRHAKVVLNGQGKVITAMGTSRGPQIWKEGTKRIFGSGSAQRKANRYGFSYLPRAIR
jgi:hypothetical protein